MTTDTPTPAPALTDEEIDIVADAFNAHPMLLGYGEADRLLIAGALAIAAVRALDLAAVIARAKREERERIADDLKRWASMFNPAATTPVILRIAADLVHHGQPNWPDTGGAR